MPDYTDQESISFKKPWVKLPDLQDLIEKNLGRTDEKIRDIVMSNFSRPMLGQIVLYAIGHMRATVLKRLASRDPTTIARQKREAAEREKEVRAMADKVSGELLKTITVNIMNMKGAAIRALTLIPIENFACVGDNQKVSEVYTYDEVHKMVLSSYRKQ